MECEPREGKGGQLPDYIYSLSPGVTLEGKQVTEKQHLISKEYAYRAGAVLISDSKAGSFHLAHSLSDRA